MRHNAFGEVAQAAGFAQFRAGSDDQFEAAPVGFQLVDLPVRANRGGQAGEQPHACQFRFRFVIVDVVTANCVDFRGVARLPGAQDDAQCGIGQVVADVANQMQACVVGLHHDVEQDNRQILVFGQRGTRFNSRISMHELELPTFDGNAFQSQQSRLVDVRLVIDNQNSPDQLAGIEIGLGLFSEGQKIVVVRGLCSHFCILSMSSHRIGFYSFGSI